MNACQDKKLNSFLVSLNCNGRIHELTLILLCYVREISICFSGNRCVRSYSFHVHHESISIERITLIVHHETKVTPKLILCHIEKYSNASATLQWIIIAIA